MCSFLLYIKMIQLCILIYIQGFPGGTVVKNLPASAGLTRDMDRTIPESGRSPEKEMATCSSILTWKFHGQRNLMGCRPWGHKESDMTDHTDAYTHIYICIIFMFFSNMVFKRFLSTIFASFNF